MLYSALSPVSYRILRTLPFVFVAGLAIVGCGDSGLKKNEAPILLFDPDPPEFVFPKIRPGEQSQGADQEIHISNTGQGTLKMANFEPQFSDEFDLYYYVDDAADHQVPAVVDGVNHIAESKGNRLDIPAGHSLTFVLNYQPTTELGASGALKFETNDRANADVSIPIVSESGAPEISVAPGALDFGRVATGDETEPQDVTVSNIGQLPLLFSSFAVSGNGFTAKVGDKNLLDDPGLQTDPDGDGAEDGQDFLEQAELGLGRAMPFQDGVEFFPRQDRRKAAPGPLDVDKLFCPIFGKEALAGQRREHLVKSDRLVGHVC